jgi:hypothetical protein
MTTAIIENQILTDPKVKPETDILENALGKNYNIYEDFVNKINAQNLNIEWNYYNDEKSWLAKILNKKKNLCWLSIWNTGFKLTFYFTEKTIKGIYELDIGNEIKYGSKIKPIGKLFPIILLAENKKVIDDGLKILEYKMRLK